MSRFIDTVYQRYISPYLSILIIAFSLIAILYVGYLAYHRYYVPTAKGKQTTTKGSGGGDVTIYLFHVDWCPHCKKAMPDWNTFSTEHNGQTVNGYKVTCVSLDCTEDSKPDIKQALEKYNVESFPTVKAVVNDNSGQTRTIAYEAKVNSKNLEKFVQTITLGNDTGL